MSNRLLWRTVQLFVMTLFVAVENKYDDDDNDDDETERTRP